MVLEETLCVDREYRNWVKTTLGLRYLKDGLHDFIEKELNALHSRLVQDVKTRLSVEDLDCRQCSFVDRDRSSDFRDSGACRNQTLCKCQNESDNRPCPSRTLEQLITECHVNKNPIFTHFNPNVWPVEPWEVAKCFTNGWGHSGPGSTRTLNDMLSICINCKDIREKISEIENFEQMLKVQHKLLLNSTFSCQEGQCLFYLGLMCQLLGDSAIGNETEADRVLELSKETVTTCRQMDEIVERLENLESTSCQHGETINQHSETISQHGETLNKHSATIRQHEKTITGDSQQLNQISADCRMAQTRQESLTVIECGHDECIRHYEEKRDELVRNAQTAGLVIHVEHIKPDGNRLCLLVRPGQSMHSTSLQDDTDVGRGEPKSNAGFHGSGRGNPDGEASDSSNEEDPRIDQVHVKGNIVLHPYLIPDIQIINNGTQFTNYLRDPSFKEIWAQIWAQVMWASRQGEAGQQVDSTTSKLLSPQTDLLPQQISSVTQVQGGADQIPRGGSESPDMLQSQPHIVAADGIIPDNPICDAQSTSVPPVPSYQNQLEDLNDGESSNKHGPLEPTSMSVLSPDKPTHQGQPSEADEQSLTGSSIYSPDANVKGTQNKPNTVEDFSNKRQLDDGTSSKCVDRQSQGCTVRQNTSSFKVWAAYDFSCMHVDSLCDDYQELLKNCNLTENRVANLTEERLHRTVELHLIGDSTESFKIAMNTKKCQAKFPGLTSDMSDVFPTTPRSEPTVLIGFKGDIEKVLECYNGENKCEHVLPRLVLLINDGRDVIGDQELKSLFPEDTRVSSTTPEALLDNIDSLLERFVFDIPRKINIVLKTLQEPAMKTDDVAEISEKLRTCGLQTVSTTAEGVKECQKKILANTNLCTEILSEIDDMYYRSEVPANERPEAIDNETNNEPISDQILTEVLELEYVIACGDRHGIVHVFIDEEIDDRDATLAEIGRVLGRNQRFSIQFIGKQMKPLSVSSGDKLVIGKTYGTIGGFAWKHFMREDKEERQLCALTSGHLSSLVAADQAVLASDESLLGHFEGPKWTGGQDLDIAILTVEDSQIDSCDIAFRDDENEHLCCKVFDFEKDDIRSLPVIVYFRGASTKLGVGVVHTKKLKIDEGKTRFMFVKDSKKESHGKFCQAGDSGAILCANDRNRQFIHIPAMIIGEYTGKDGSNGYVALHLSAGLSDLERRHRCKFTVCNHVNET